MLPAFIQIKSGTFPRMGLVMNYHFNQLTNASTEGDGIT